jgi:hypothetical protein
MKRTKSVIIVLLVFSTVSVTQVHMVEAESADYIQFYAFTLYSPLNRTYNSRLLNLSLTFSAGLGIKYSLSYNIDEEHEGDIPFEIENPKELHVIYRANGYLMLPELSEGTHNLTINLLASGYQFGNPYFTGSVQFTIKTQSQPNIIPEFESSTILLLILSGIIIAFLLGKNPKTKKGYDNEE